MSVTTTRAPEEATRTLDLVRFERIELRDPANWVDLIVDPGAAERITVHGPRDLVDRVRIDVRRDSLHIGLAGTVTERVRDALTTSLNRRRLTYRIQARRVLEVRVRGLVRVSVEAFGADAPVVTRLVPHPAWPAADHPR